MSLQHVRYAEKNLMQPGRHTSLGNDMECVVVPRDGWDRRVSEFLWLRRE